MTQKTKPLLIWTFLRAAKPRLGSRFVKSKLVPHQALFTTHKTEFHMLSHFTHVWNTSYGRTSLFVGLDCPFLLLSPRQIFLLLFNCYLWKDITILTLLHSSQQESCLLTNVNWSVSIKRKNAIPSDWLNK